MARGKPVGSAKSTTNAPKGTETGDEIDTNEDDPFSDDLFLDDIEDEDDMDDMYVDFGQPLLESKPGRSDVNFPNSGSIRVILCG
jgi:hypothetical protein